MKKITDYLLVVVMLFALQACSDDDEPKHVDPARISGNWYITNIRGWEYVGDGDNDGHRMSDEEYYKRYGHHRNRINFLSGVH